MLKTQLTRSIAFRFMAYLLMFSIFITLLGTILELYYDYQENLKIIQKSMDDIKMTYSGSLAQALWDLDDDQIQTQVSGLLSLPNISYVKIDTPHQKIEQGVRPSLSTVQSFELTYHKTNAPNVPISLGTVQVEASLMNIMQRLQDRTGIIFLTEGAKISVLAGFVLMIFYLMVTRHLNVMANYAQKLNVGRLDKPLTIDRVYLLESSNDELSQVVQSINEMRKTLQIQLAERRISEDALAEQWELLNNVLSNIPSSIYWKNRDLIYLGCNFNFAKDADCESPEEIIGKSDRDLPWEAIDATAYETLDNTVLSTGSPAINVEQKRHRANGNVSTILVSKVPIKNVLGQIIGLLGVHTDITEMKAAERQFRELNENLELRVKERTLQLELSTKELSKSLSQLQDSQNQLVEMEKMAALGNLVAGIAHEVNTPVSIGTTTASHLKDNAEKINILLESRELKKNDFNEFIMNSIELTGIILSNLERAAELIRGFKQIAVDQSSGAKREFTVNTYLEEILISLGPQLKKSKHTLSISCPKEISIYSNPGAFSQIITQLFNNAIIHAFENKERGHMQIQVVTEGNCFILRFSDDGSGIPEQIVGQIFDPFFTTKRGTGGSGLGLHILHNTAQSLGGKIEVSSKVGEGTTFTLTIPLEKLRAEDSDLPKHGL